MHVGQLVRVRVRTWCGSCWATRESLMEIEVLRVEPGRWLGRPRATPEDRVMLRLFVEAHRGPFGQSSRIT